MSKRLALLVTVALMGALVACEPASQGKCVRWGTKQEKVYVYTNKSGRWHTYYRDVKYCVKYERAM